MVYILSVSHMGFILTVITNNKKCVRQKIEEGKFHSFNKASLQQTPMFHKKKKKIHNNNNNIETKTKTKQELPWVAYSFGLVSAPPSES